MARKICRADKGALQGFAVTRPRLLFFLISHQNTWFSLSFIHTYPYLCPWAVQPSMRGHKLLWNEKRPRGWKEKEEEGRWGKGEIVSLAKTKKGKERKVFKIRRGMCLGGQRIPTCGTTELRKERGRRKEAACAQVPQENPRPLGSPVRARSRWAQAQPADRHSCPAALHTCRTQGCAKPRWVTVTGLELLGWKLGKIIFLSQNQLNMTSSYGLT